MESITARCVERQTRRVMPAPPQRLLFHVCWTTLLSLLAMLAIPAGPCLANPPLTLSAINDPHPESDKKLIGDESELAWLSSCGAAFQAFVSNYVLSNEITNEKLELYIAKHHGAEAYLALMILLKQNVNVEPALIAEILCARLGEFEDVGEWSWIQRKETESVDFYLADTLIHCGEAALPFLSNLLERKGLVLYNLSFGSEASVHVRVIRLRRCDLAARYMARILGVPWEIGEYKDRDERWSALHQAAENRLRDGKAGKPKQ